MTRKECPNCDGTGDYRDNETELGKFTVRECFQCRGTGIITVHDNRRPSWPFSQIGAFPLGDIYRP